MFTAFTLVGNVGKRTSSSRTPFTWSTVGKKTATCVLSLGSGNVGSVALARMKMFTVKTVTFVLSLVTLAALARMKIFTEYGSYPYMSARYYMYMPWVRFSRTEWRVRIGLRALRDQTKQSWPAGEKMRLQQKFPFVKYVKLRNQIPMQCQCKKWNSLTTRSSMELVYVRVNSDDTWSAS